MAPAPYPVSGNQIICLLIETVIQLVVSFYMRSESVLLPETWWCEAFPPETLKEATLSCLTYLPSPHLRVVILTLKPNQDVPTPTDARALNLPAKISRQDSLLLWFDQKKILQQEHFMYFTLIKYSNIYYLC